MPIRYTRVGWQDAPSTETPIDAANLNHMDNGILAISQELDTELDTIRDEFDALEQDTSSQIDSFKEETSSQISKFSSDITTMQNGLPGMISDKMDAKYGQEIGDNVTSWLTEHVNPAGSAVVVDDTLTIQGAAADAKKTGDELTSLKEDIGDLSELETADKSDLVSAINEAAQSGGSSTGITNAVKQALLACFENVAWATEDGQDYYDALLASMEVPATAISVRPSTVSFSSASETQQITASITPRDSSDTIVWTTSNSSVAIVSNSGLVTPIANGSCTITATAGNVSATCSVTVSGIVRSFDVVNSLTHVTNSNSNTRVAEGDSYTATLSADNGYWLTNAVVTMGGEDITSTAYDNGTISIAEITGEITIYAIAKEMTIINTNWTRGNIGATGNFVNQKWYGAYVTDMITMGANQTLVVYNTNPNWTTNYTGTDGNGRIGNNCQCIFYQNADSPSYINPGILVTDERTVLTFSSDTSKVANYKKTIGARVHISNLVDYLSTVVVGLIDEVV